MLNNFINENEPYFYAARFLCNIFLIRHALAKFLKAWYNEINL